MNKSELISAIAEQAGLTKADAKKAVEAYASAVAGALAAGDSVAILGFGTYSVATRPARTGINPRTQEKIDIAEKKIIKFKPGAALSAQI